VADCYRCSYARGGVKLPYGTPGFECPECGALLELIWPDERKVYALARLLAMRPIVHTRNWNPDETLHDLLRENGEHGIFDRFNLDELDYPGPPLIIDDDGIRFDRLPMIESPLFKAIGA